MYKFKAAERQMDKIEAQITVIREDIERKSDNAARSPMLRGGKERELTELSQEFSDLVDGYGEMHVNLGCPCCRGVPNAKKAAREMMEAADELRSAFPLRPLAATGKHLQPAKCFALESMERSISQQRQRMFCQSLPLASCKGLPAMCLEIIPAMRPETIPAMCPRTVLLTQRACLAGCPKATAHLQAQQYDKLRSMLILLAQINSPGFSICRESFTEGPNMSPMPHSVISARRELYEEKAYEACELRKEAVERLLFFVGESKEFLASFQSLQEQFHRMVSCRAACLPATATSQLQELRLPHACASGQATSVLPALDI